jgi:hypothetical protein
MERPDVSAQSEKVLSSWKEIAVTLCCGVRTAQRYESQGLPIYRPEGAVANVVIAFESELREWLKNSSLDPICSEELPLQTEFRIAYLKKQLAKIEKKVEQLDSRLKAIRQEYLSKTA